MGIGRPGSGEVKIVYFSWVVSCRLIWLNPRAWWGREKCLVQGQGRGVCPGLVLDCGSGIKCTVKFGTQQ